MALALDASAPANSTGTTVALTTASFTPPAGAVLLAMMGANNPGATDASFTTVTNTGTAATWTRRKRKTTHPSSDGGSGTNGGVEIWTATAPGGAITVTATNGVVTTGAGFEKMLKIMVITGADTTALTNGGAAFSTSGLPSVAVAGCSVGSYVFAMASDWSQKGAGTAGTAQTIINESDVAGQITFHAWRTTSTLASAGSQTMNLTAVAAQQYNLVALEVKDSGGGGAAATPPELIMTTLRR